jgi:hypothetical protein
LPRIRREEEEAVLALLEEPRFDWDAGVSKCFKEHDAVVHVDKPVVGRMEDQGGRCVLGHLEFVGEETDVVF